MALEPEELLAHADFMRTLALNLVMDEHSAEDVSQQSWLASLERSPPAGTPIRAWLSRVTWNLAVKLIRGESRRWKRERAAALPDRVPSAEEVAAREETRRRVVDAVMALDEPYRAVILLRFYEDLPPRDIARSLEVPVETVRTRLKRGLSKLRRRLDEENNQNRRKWCLALAPVAGLKMAQPSAGAAASGSLVLGAKIKIGIAAAVILGVSFTLWHTFIESSFLNGDIEVNEASVPPEKSTPPGEYHALSTNAMRERVRITPESTAFSGRVIDEISGRPVTDFQLHLIRKENADSRLLLVRERGYAQWFRPLKITGEDRRGLSPSKDGEAEDYILEVETPADLGFFPTWRPLPPEAAPDNFSITMEPWPFLFGRVKDERGRPLESALLDTPFLLPDISQSHLLLVREEGYAQWFRPLEMMVKDEEGRFSLQLEEGGRYTLRVNAPGYIPALPTTLQIPAKGGLQDFLIGLEPWQSLSGRVVEDESGRPVEGALVAAQIIRTGSIEFQGYDDCAETDGDGRFTLTRLRGMTPDKRSRWQYRIAACHPGFAETAVEAAPGNGRVEIRLKTGCRIFGTVRDYRGQPNAGVNISVWGPGTPVVRVVETGLDGTYTTPPLAAGTMKVKASLPHQSKARRMRSGRFDFIEETRTVEISDHDREVHFGPTPEHVLWSGTLHDGKGRPLELAEIRLKSLDGQGRAGPLLPGAVQYTAQCDRDGRFEINGIVPGSYLVHLFVPGEDRGAGYELETVNLDYPGEAAKDIRLPDTDVSGILIDGETGRPVKEGIFWIKAFCYDPHFSSQGKRFVTRTDDTGRFRFQGLPAGAYSFRAVALFEDGGLGFTPLGAQVDRPVFISERRVEGDLRLVLPFRGKVVVRVVGLEPSLPFDGFIRRADGAVVGKCGFRYIAEEGCWESVFLWDVGSWILALEGEASKGRERSFNVIRNETTTLLIEHFD